MRNASIPVLAAALLWTSASAANAASWSRGDTGTNQISGTAIALGATSISQQTDNTPGIDGVSCGNENTGATLENSFYRRFYLSEHGAAPSATVSAVTIGLRDGDAGANDAVPITVNLYTIPASTPADTIPLAALTPIGSATLNLSVPAGNAPTSFTIPVTGTIADTAANNLVVEWTNGAGAQTLPGFYPANNTAAETHPSFIRAPECGTPAPVPFASIGFDSALIMVVEGSGLPVSLQQFEVD
ncbi:MAG TPA: hypothetical protein VMR06_00930 [Dokdonella sp.]|uniref:hypothetical protein n=1 Tax=Dokdonella sp. TaxID=2291710 RepID=UPI002C7AE2A6|nr:hypothetical protein [Dokdonella sp.]HUD40542.1 hypothetical protein [Dokdonella sp.]